MVATLPALAAGQGRAEAGQLDPGFGTAGINRVDLSLPSVDVARAVYANGSSSSQWLAGSSGDRMALAWRGWDGSEARTTLDFGVPAAAHALMPVNSGFALAGTAGGDFALAYVSSSFDPISGIGTNGLVRTAFGADAVGRALAWSSAPRGKLAGTVVAGEAATGQGGAVALARYLSTTAGITLDPAFGNGGTRLDDITPGLDAAYAILDTSLSFEARNFVAGRAGGAAFVAQYLYDGRLDPSFGADGRSIFDITPGDDIAYAVASGCGGYLIAGAAGNQAFVARLNGWGVLDPTFGAGGYLLTDLGGTSARFTGVRPVANIGSECLLSGTVTSPSGSQDLVVAKIRAAGAFDPAFGTSGTGWTVVDSGAPGDVAHALAVTESGPLVVGGTGTDMVSAALSRDGTSVTRHTFGFGGPSGTVVGSVGQADSKTLIAGGRAEGPYLARLLADGSRDPAFGAAGVVATGLGLSPIPSGVALMPDGKAVLVTYTTRDFNISVEYIYQLTRFLPDGRRDWSFSAPPLVVSVAKSQNAPSPPQLLPLAGGKLLFGFNWSLFRVNETGALDPTFDGDGRTQGPTGALVLEPAGTVLALSRTESENIRFLTAHRIAADGAVTHLWNGAFDLDPTAAILQPDGKLVVAGIGGGGTRSYGAFQVTRSTDTLVARYLPSGVRDLSFGGIGQVTLDLGVRERPVAVVLGPGGTLTVGVAVDYRMAVARLSATGAADRTFARGGGERFPMEATLVGLGIQSDAKAVLVATLTSPTGLSPALLRFVPAGPTPVPARTWGSNPIGELGDASRTQRRSPVAPAGLANVREVAAGWYHSVAVLDDGSVWTWGWNGVGQLGTGSTADSAVPVRVPTLYGIVAVAAGAHHTLALGADGTLWAWGWNAYGQLGDGTTENRSRPILVPNDYTMGHRVVDIAAGVAHSLSVQSGGTVRGWGWNGTGQLGDGTNTDRHTPTEVYEVRDVVQIAAGALHTVATTSGGYVLTWGWNAVGQLGAGQIGDSWIPFMVPGVSGVSFVEAGAYHSFAVNQDGTVWAWGWNVLGELGDGTTTTRMSPVKLGLTNVAALAGGTFHAVAMTTDGSVLTWGWNGVGQLGDGTITDRRTPARVVTIAGGTTVAAGPGHTLAG